MVLGFIYMQMAAGMRVIGLMMYKMVWAKKFGLMGVNILEIIKMDLNMGLGNINGQIIAGFKGSGAEIVYRDKGYFNMMMVDCIMENGLKIKCMAKGFTNGLMAEYMKEVTLMTRKKVMGFTLILTEGATRACGKKVFNMEKVLVCILMAKKLKVHGIKENVYEAMERYLIAKVKVATLIT